jgi:hypothetical protein
MNSGGRGRSFDGKVVWVAGARQERSERRRTSACSSPRASSDGGVTEMGHR